MIDRCLAFCLSFALLWVAAPAHSEDQSSLTFSGESRAAALRLAEARKFLEDHKWSEAIETLQSILNNNGNELVAIAPGYSVRAGRLCQIQLASLPAAGLRLYRQRYENQARKKLQQAQAERDIAQLRKLVEETFCTRAAEKAIDLLGDLAFERGRFEEAEEWWRLLAPLPDARHDAATRDLALVYPDLSLDPARIQAKQLLARLFQGANNEWQAALETFRQQHAKAEGTLAGRQGRYSDLLQALAEQIHKEKNDGHKEVKELAWERGSVCFCALGNGRPIPAPEDILDRLSELCGQGPTWSFDLEQRSRQEFSVFSSDGRGTQAVNAAQARTLAFYPAIVGHRILVADARYVTAFDLRTGQSEEWYDVARHNGGVQPNLQLPAPPDLRYTLSVAEGHVYVRLGAQGIGIEQTPPLRRFGPPPPRPDNETFLACLALQPNEKGEHFRWHIRGIAHDNSFFEGVPLVADGLIWIASTRYNGNRCIMAIDCYTADDASEPPLRWRCDLCESSAVKGGELRYRHHLLTLAGTQIVYCTHNGAVVAIDALSGRRNWAVRYPRRTLETPESELRDLTPVLFVGGRLYVAPADSDTLLCLDPATGRTLWELEPLRVVHLLGVGQGRLIFTTPTGLRAVRADTGAPVWSVPDTGSLTPAGRGLLIGDLVLFPTTQLRDPASPWMEGVVYVLRQLDGRPADDPAKLHRLPAGNLAYADGILAVADRQTLSVFVPPRLLLDKRKSEARRQPSSAVTLLQLAHAQADAARYQEALQTFDRIERLLRREPKTVATKRVQTQLLRAKQNTLLALAQHAVQTQCWQEADEAFQQAAANAPSPRFRLHALLRAAQSWSKVKQNDRAAAAWQTIRTEEQLSQIQVVAKDGKPVSAAEWADAHLGPGRQGHVGIPRGQPPRSMSLTRPAQGQPLPLFRAWHVQMDNDEWILAGWREGQAEGLLSGTRQGWLNCRCTGTGERRWTRRLPFVPHWACCYGNQILAAGAEGVACLHCDNGRLLWHFPAPAADRSPRSCCDEVHVVLDPRPSEPLTDFLLVSGRLFFLQGQRRLFALDAETGQVLWHRWAPDGPLSLSFPQGCFSPCYYAGSKTVLIQMSGRRWLLDATTGQILHEAADNRDLWQRLPLELDEHTLCVVMDNRRVMLLDAQTGQCLWTHRLSGVTIPSGEAPFVLGRGHVLLCVQPANIGYFLQRLDRASGQSVWPQPQLLTMKRLDWGQWDFDSEAVYTVEDRLLVARSLADGAVRWRRPLTVPGGQVRCVGDYLALWPETLGYELCFRFHSFWGTVQWDLGPLLAPEAVFPLFCYNPKTGQLVQRLNFRIASPVRTAWAKRRDQEEGKRAWMGRTSCLLASPDGPVICLDSPRPFVAFGGEVWGLSATDPIDLHP